MKNTLPTPGQPAPRGENQQLRRRIADLELGHSGDITQREHAEEAERESEDRYRLLFDNMQEGLAYCLMLEERGQPSDFVYLTVNHAFETLTGLKRVLGRRVTEVIPGIRETNPEVFQIYGRVASTGKPETFDSYVAPLGKWFHVSAYCPREGHFVAMFSDFTARKQAEEEHSSLQQQFQQAQKMETIGRLAGGVAHDFNNLLTVINGYSDLLLSTLKEGDPMREPLVEISKAGGHAASLTQQLLAVSRRQVLDPKPLDLNGLVAGNRKMLQRLVCENIVLVTELAPSLELVMADQGQIHQVLMNLVVNARDAMPAGGRLTIGTQNVEVNAGLPANCLGIDPGNYVLLTVADTGTGMDRETQQHIFEPFFTTKGEGKGTGLGLSTVYGIVRQLLGGVFVKSEEGKGTTFSVYLPRIEAAVTGTSVATPVAGSLQGSETVLVVDDQEGVRRLTVGVLRRQGYFVLEAPAGGEALSVAGHHTGPIDLLVTDVVMPQMTGKELAERLKPLRPEMKVLYISGYEGNILADQSVLDSGVSYLLKPFMPNELTAKVRSVLDVAPLASILLVDDSEQIRSIYRKVLEDAGYAVRDAGTAAEALSRMNDFPANLVMADLNLEGQSGVALVAELRRAFPKVKTILMSAAFDNAGVYGLALAEAADRILPKPMDGAELRRVIADTLA